MNKNKHKQLKQAFINRNGHILKRYVIYYTLIIIKYILLVEILKYLNKIYKFKTLMNYRTQTNILPHVHDINEQMWPLFMFVHLTKRTKFLVRVCSIIEQTNFPPNGSQTVR
ncbi:hypothetical protein HanRHA438_Chr10g0435641 [Helianthus annuus]|nr:hypothetical protein HanRHA438_Chr10g0435641 [Helianthus annuus]